MSNTKLNCCKCGKEFGFTERIYTSGDLWQCEDCAIKQMQENDDKDKKIADLEAKLAEKEEYIEEIVEVDKINYEKLHKEIDQLKQQLAEKEQNIEEINKEFVQAVKDWKSLVEQKK